MSKSNKLEYLLEKKLSPADDLREDLNRLEEVHFKVKLMDSTEVLALLQDLDQVEAKFDELEAKDLDLRSERGRFESIQGRLEKKAASLLKTIGGPTVLREHRPTPPPPPEQWWWYMNEMVAAQNQRLMRRVIIGLVIVLLIIGAVVLVFNTILKPSEEVIARLNAENDANYAVEDKNYDEALTIIEEGLTKVPGDPSLLLFKGVLHQVLGDEELAEQTFVQVQEILDDPISFHLARAQLYLRANQLEQAESEALIALELDENFARSWLTLGQALEFQGKVLEAIEAYEKAGKFAFDNNENEVYVLSRMAIARLSQMPPPLPGEATEESETPTP